MVTHSLSQKGSGAREKGGSSLISTARHVSRNHRDGGSPENASSGAATESVNMGKMMAIVTNHERGFSKAPQNPPPGQPRAFAIQTHCS